MSGFLAVAVREIRQRRAVLVAALVAGVVALAVPALSSLGRRDVREARELAALVFAAAFACAVALVVGGGMITRELLERRHGFLFSRPLSPGAIWGGKVAAAWLLALGAGAAALLPATLASRGFHLLGAVAPWGAATATLAIAAAALLALVVYGHAVALMVRSRVSWLLALDAASSLAVLSTVAWCGRSLYVARAGTALVRGLAGFAALAAAAALGAGMAQVIRGRTDAARGHRTLSAVLWATLACGALAFAGYSRWVLAAAPRDLVGVGFVQAAPRGSWTALLGSRAVGRGDFYPKFLFDTATGRSVRLQTAERFGSDIAFSNDGRVAAWLASDGAGATAPSQVVALDLTDPAAQPVATTVVLGSASGRELVLSPGGRRIAVVGRALAEVYELSSGRLLATARFPVAASTRAFFLPGGGSLRIESRAQPDAAGSEAWKAPSEVTIRELDVSSRTVSETGRIASVGALSFWVMQHDPARDRIAVTASGGGGTVTALRDGRTGAVLATLAASSAGQPRALFLGDGRVVLAPNDASTPRLQLFAPDGASAGAIELGAGEHVGLGGEAAPGRVIARVWGAPDAPRGEASLVLVDVATRRVARLGAGFAPLEPVLMEFGAAETGSVAARLFRMGAGGLALLDPDAGTFRSVLRTRGAAE
ncbi:MAG TPA: hypothetical protein VMT19_04760 [Thermoanaerobaculaceae bacterium]|nr:hypothetical protein [Thermoanaerobaculaceae bacterium]